MKLTQTRAADTLALGIFETKTLDVPVPGAPEVLYKGGPYGMNGISSRPRGGLGDCGCGCKGAGTCGGGLGDVIADIKAMSMPAKIAAAIGVVLLAKHVSKRRG